MFVAAFHVSGDRLLSTQCGRVQMQGRLHWGSCQGMQRYDPRGKAVLCISVSYSSSYHAQLHFAILFKGDRLQIIVASEHILIS